MGAPSLDNNFFLIWSQLTIEKQKQLLSVAQELLDADEADKEFKLSEEQWQEVQSVRESIANGANTYTREEAREMILNKEKRNGLSA